MKVLLTGATGYIGGAVADALLASGHEVLGLARSDESEAKLREKGITPARGDLKDPSAIAAAVSQADAIIHAAATMDADMAATDTATVEAILGALGDADKPFIYTSGVWVHGATGNAVATEDSPLNPPAAVAWRPANEQRALTGARYGVVIRPAMVCGRGGGFVAGFVQSAREKGAAEFVGDGSNRWPFVDVDDLADLYVRALKAPAGSVYVASAGDAVAVKDIAKAASQAAGAGGKVTAVPLEQARQAMGPFADAVVLDQQFSSAKAEQELGWKPKAESVLEDIADGSYGGGAKG